MQEHGGFKALPKTKDFIAALKTLRHPKNQSFFSKLFAPGAEVRPPRNAWMLTVELSSNDPIVRAPFSLTLPLDCSRVWVSRFQANCRASQGVFWVNLIIGTLVKVSPHPPHEYHNN
jgi:hypothetical protein